jgi:hypothetical protein
VTSAFDMTNPAAMPGVSGGERSEPARTDGIAATVAEAPVSRSAPPPLAHLPGPTPRFVRLLFAVPLRPNTGSASWPSVMLPRAGQVRSAGSFAARVSLPLTFATGVLLHASE